MNPKNKLMENFVRWIARADFEGPSAEKIEWYRSKVLELEEELENTPPKYRGACRLLKEAYEIKINILMESAAP